LLRGGDVERHRSVNQNLHDDAMHSPIHVLCSGCRGSYAPDDPALNGWTRGAKEYDGRCCHNDRSGARRDEACDGWIPTEGSMRTGALMPFAVGTLVAYNVQSFTKPREPTARAAKGFPPPVTEADYLARGGQRPKAVPRKTGVMRRKSHNGS
jgi:hypothetical protein